MGVTPYPCIAQYIIYFLLNYIEESDLSVDNGRVFKHDFKEYLGFLDNIFQTFYVNGFTINTETF